MAVPARRDYSMTGPEGAKAQAAGLVAAQWYRPDVPRQQIKALMQRTDGPAIRDTALWLSLFVVFGVGGFHFWGTWWCVPLFAGYGVLYGSSADSRWHECGHGTAFRTQWKNDVVYHLASFMMIRSPTAWRWSHTRHHTDTIIVGRDPEIVAPRPPNFFMVALNLLGIPNAITGIQRMLIHATGRLTAEERTYVPETEWPKAYRVARIWLVIHGSVIVLALYLGSWLPVVYIGALPAMYGAWLGVSFAMTQHLGLAEDVLDHRLNSRTVYMNPIFRFLYWNMNYHLEHHMFPMVPYHALPKLHAILLPDTPKPCASTIEAFAEVVTALIRQRKNPRWTVRRALPASARPYQLGAAVAAQAE